MQLWTWKTNLRQRQRMKDCNYDKLLYIFSLSIIAYNVFIMSISMTLLMFAFTFCIEASRLIFLSPICQYDYTIIVYFFESIHKSSVLHWIALPFSFWNCIWIRYLFFRHLSTLELAVFFSSCFYSVVFVLNDKKACMLT